MTAHAKFANHKRLLKLSINKSKDNTTNHHRHFEYDGIITY